MGLQDVPTMHRVITEADIPQIKDHHLEFHPITRLLTKDNLAKKAQECKNNAERMLGYGDCQAAAFYLGAMCHYIADAVYYPHFTERGGAPYPSQSLRLSLRWRIHYLTSRKRSDWQYCNGQPTEVEPFFDDLDARGYWGVNGYKYKSAWSATWWAAYHTFYGEAVDSSIYVDPDMDRPYRPSLTFIDAWEMIDYYDYSGDYMPPGFDINTLKTVERRDDYWAQFDPGFDRNYLLALQHHLNLGVWYCAGVINHVKDSYTKCETGIERELAQLIEQLQVEYAFLWMMAGLGQFALFIVLAQTAVSSFSEDKLSLFTLQYVR